MRKYTCWGEDKEDLPEEVLQKIKGEPIPVPALRRRSAKRSIEVECSKGHKNIFKVEVEK